MAALVHSRFLLDYGSAYSFRVYSRCKANALGLWNFSTERAALIRLWVSFPLWLAFCIWNFLHRRARFCGIGLRYIYG
jgi:hypothetical protein